MPSLSPLSKDEYSWFNVFANETSRAHIVRGLETKKCCSGHFLIAFAGTAGPFALPVRILDKLLLEWPDHLMIQYFPGTFLGSPRHDRREGLKFNGTSSLKITPKNTDPHGSPHLAKERKLGEGLLTEEIVEGQSQREIVNPEEDKTREIFSPQMNHRVKSAFHQTEEREQNKADETRKTTDAFAQRILLS
jgi:hypothetical protein